MKKACDFLRRQCSRHRAVCLPLGVFAVGMLLALFIFFSAIYPLRNELTGKRLAGGNHGHLSASLTAQSKLEQVIAWDKGVLGFRLPVATYGQTWPTLELRGAVYDNATNELLIEFHQLYENVAEPDVLEVSFVDFVKAPSGAYRFEFSFPGIPLEAGLSVWTSDSADASACIDGEAQPGALDLILCGNSAFLFPVFWVMAVFLCGLTALLASLCFVRKTSVGKIFILAATGFGLLHSLLYMPYAHADDATHIPTAYYYSSRMLGADTWLEDASVHWMQRTEDEPGCLTSYLTKHRDKMYHVYSNLLTGEAFPGQQSEASVSLVGQFYQYLPQTLGITAGRLLGLGQVGTLYLGRWLCLAAYIACICAAAYKNPYQNLFYLLGLCPFMLGAAGTYSYDTSIVMLAFLFTGQVFRFAFGPEPLRIRYVFLLLATGALLAPLKYVYIPLLLLLLLIPFKKWKGMVAETVLWQRALLGLGALAGALLAFFVLRWSFGYMQSVLSGGQDPTTGVYASGIYYNFSMLLSKPAEMIRLLAVTAVDRLDEVLASLGGFYHFRLPWWTIIVCWALLAAGVNLPAGQELPLVKTRQKMGLGLCWVAVYGLALVAALQWTPIGGYYINGMQGRYLLPMMPVFLLLFSGVFPQKEEVRPESLFFCLFLVNAYTAPYLFQHLALNYL